MMTSQSAESDYCFAALPTPQKYQFVNKQWIPRATSTSQPTCISTMIGEIEHEFDHLRQENINSTLALQRSHQENVKLLQTLQRKEQYLQAAQQRIGKLEREVHMVKGVAGHMQNWECRLAACGKMIPMCQQSCQENIQPKPISNDGARMNEQGHVPHLQRSDQSTTWKADSPHSQQSPRQAQQPAVEQKPPLDRRD